MAVQFVVFHDRDLDVPSRPRNAIAASAHQPGDARGLAVELNEAVGKRARWPAITLGAQVLARSRFGLGAMVRDFGELYAALTADDRVTARSGPA